MVIITIVQQVAGENHPTHHHRPHLPGNYPLSYISFLGIIFNLMETFLSYLSSSRSHSQSTSSSSRSRQVLLLINNHSLYFFLAQIISILHIIFYSRYALDRDREVDQNVVHLL
jgi:hypothetical protein